MNTGSFAVKSYFGKRLWSISYKVTNNFKSCVIKKTQNLFLKIYKETKLIYLNMLHVSILIFQMKNIPTS